MTVIHFSQTKLSHYLNGRKKIRGWQKLEATVKEVLNNFDALEAASASSEDERGDVTSSSDSVMSKEEDGNASSEYSDYISEPNDDEADHWSKFSLNEIFNTSNQSKK